MAERKMAEMDWKQVEIPQKRAELALRMITKGQEMKVSKSVLILTDEKGNVTGRGVFPASIERVALVYAHMVAYMTERAGGETLMLTDVVKVGEYLQLTSPLLANSSIQDILERVAKNPKQNKLNISHALARRYLEICPAYKSSKRIRADALALMARIIEEMMIYSVEQAMISARKFRRKSIKPEDFTGIFPVIEQKELENIVKKGKKFIRGGE